MEFKKLNPTDEVELGIYEKAMEFIFSDDDIQNVAISGAYGAGKSSILESYKKKLEKEGDNKKFLHISLAHFENKEKDNTKYAKLEGKILNQLLHQIRAEKIPLTNFKIKKSADSSEINNMLISMYFAHKLIGYGACMLVEDIGITLVCSIVMGMTVYCISVINIISIYKIIIQIVVGIIIYLAMSVLTKNKNMHICIEFIREQIEVHRRN